MIDLHRLGRWMDNQDLPGPGEPIEHRFLSGGTQNEIYEISRGELRCAMRIPPPSAPAGRDEGIRREWRIIEALTGTDVPHAEAVAVCADPSVLGRAFYLMGFVDGWSPMNQPGWPAPFDTDLPARQALAYQMAEGIARLSAVDWRARGLHDLGRPDGFHERQVDRWTAFLERIKGRELPGFDVAAGWLRAHRPLDYIPGLMHGDYQLANVMFRHGGPARLAAIVDWEMGTVGDPKLDMAWMVQSWPEEVTASPATDFPGHPDLSGMPPRSALLARYAEVSGRQVEDIDYYLVLAKWKFAVVLEQGFQRAGDDVKLQAFGPVVLELMRGAAELAESTDYRFLGRYPSDSRDSRVSAVRAWCASSHADLPSMIPNGPGPPLGRHGLLVREACQIQGFIPSAHCFHLADSLAALTIAAAGNTGPGAIAW